MNNNLNLIIDIDGVMTDGGFYYDSKGKILKRFGAHDSDGIKLVKPFFNIMFISADMRGFLISKKRILDMGFELYHVKEEDRLSFVKKHGFENCIFIADGHFDVEVLKKVKIGIATKNATDKAKKNANYITKSIGGNGAVYEACIYLIKKLKLPVR